MLAHVSSTINESSIEGEWRGCTSYEHELCSVFDSLERVNGIAIFDRHDFGFLLSTRIYSLAYEAFPAFRIGLCVSGGDKDLRMCTCILWCIKAAAQLVTEVV
jgi:hypothetical protein